MNLAKLMGSASVEQDALSCCRLAGINVGDDTDVTSTAQRQIVAHLYSPCPDIRLGRDEVSELRIAA